MSRAAGIPGGLLAAFGFLTRLPLPRGADEGDMARSVVWFPLVGAGVGAVVGCVHALVAPVTNQLTGAALAVTIGILITGGLHEDGLADTADGFGGGWTAEQRLAIMDDPRQGTYGVLALCCSVVLRVAALSGLAGWEAVAACTAVHLLARVWAVAVLMGARSAGTGGLARSVRRLTAPGLVPAALVLSAGVGLAIAGPPVFALILAAGLVTTSAAVALAYRKIGGVTGDVLGTVEQLAEVSGLVVTVGAVSRWGLGW